VVETTGTVRNSDCQAARTAASGASAGTCPTRMSIAAARLPRMIFAAPARNDPLDPSLQPKVSVTCSLTRLRRTVPPRPGTFQARCLGRVQGWSPNTRELVIDPVAIFQ
jgi:hypothetical protein